MQKAISGSRTNGNRTKHNTQSSNRLGERWRGTRAWGNGIEVRFLEDRPGDELPGEFAVFEDLNKSTECHKIQIRTAREIFHPPFNRKLGLLPILHALVVRNVPAGTNDRELSSPDNLHDSEDGSVDIRFGVPVAGNKEHVLTDVNARFVDAERCPSSVVFAFHVNVADVAWRFVDRDVRAKADNLPARPQRPKVVTFNECPGLSSHESHEDESKCSSGVPFGPAVEFAQLA